MLTLELKRYAYLPTSTQGRLMTKGARLCWTLENPFKGNQRSISCIPEGTYLVEPYTRPSGAAALIVSGEDVSHFPGSAARYGILFHSGNLVKHTEGCILPGRTRGNGAVYSSQSAMSALLDLVKEPAKLIISVDHDIDWS